MNLTGCVRWLQELCVGEENLGLGSHSYSPVGLFFHTAGNIDGLRAPCSSASLPLDRRPSFIGARSALLIQAHRSKTLMLASDVSCHLQIHMMDVVIAVANERPWIATLPDG
jgi:hypothetical protein